MKKTLLIVSIVFAVIGLIFTILPMGTIAVIPLAIAIVCALISMLKYEVGKKNLPKWVLIVSAVLFVIVIGKEVLVKDEVTVDKQFQEQIEASKQDAKQELEGLE